MSEVMSGDGKIYYSGSNWTSAGAGAAAPKDPLESASDQELIFEMLKRGYAVAKMDAQELAENVAK
jgi:hypothetical protein